MKLSACLRTGTPDVRRVTYEESYYVPSATTFGRLATVQLRLTEGIHLRHPDRLHPDELRLQLRVALLEEHLDDIAQVALQLVEAGAQAVGAGPAGHAPDVQPRLGIPFDDRIERSHPRPLTCETF